MVRHGMAVWVVLLDLPAAETSRSVLRVDAAMANHMSYRSD